MVEAGVDFGDPTETLAATVNRLAEVPLKFQPGTRVMACRPMSWAGWSRSPPEWVWTGFRRPHFRALGHDRNRFQRAGRHRRPPHRVL